MEALDGLLSFDGRAWKTLPPLVVFPRRITRKYLSGSRARFIPPFRVYIIASLIFFLIFGLRTNDLTFNSDGLSNAIDFSGSRLEKFPRKNMTS